MSLIEKLNFDEKGLIPTIIQDDKTSKVLTLCYMNKEALDMTIKEKKIYVYRRSKGRIMLKGETSGNIQTVKSVYIDCANNSVLFRIDPKGPGCHEGYFTCYFQKIKDNGQVEIEGERLFDPKEVYKEK